jgi:hypothetical protein
VCKNRIGLSELDWLWVGRDMRKQGCSFREESGAGEHSAEVVNNHLVDVIRVIITMYDGIRWNSGWKADAAAWGLVEGVDDRAGNRFVQDAADGGSPVFE